MRFAAALAQLEEARPVEEQLLRRDPHNTVVQHDVAVSQGMRGEALLRTGKRRESVQAYEQALKLRRQLAESAGASAGRRRVADALGKLGAGVQGGGPRRRRRRLRREAVDLYEQRWSAQPDERNRQPLADALDLLADTCAAAGLNEQAVSAAPAARSTARRLRSRQSKARPLVIEVLRG